MMRHDFAESWSRQDCSSCCAVLEGCEHKDRVDETQVLSEQKRCNKLDSIPLPFPCIWCELGLLFLCALSLLIGNVLLLRYLCCIASTEVHLPRMACYACCPLACTQGTMMRLEQLVLNMCHEFIYTRDQVYPSCLAFSMNAPMLRAVALLYSS